MSEKPERGQRRRSSAEVERIVAGYEDSGLSKQGFCEKHGLSMSTLDRHRKKQKRVAGRAARDTQWVAVEIGNRAAERGTESAPGLIVKLANERRIEVGNDFDAKLLRDLVRALEQV